VNPPAGITIEAVVPPLALLDAALQPGSGWEEIGENRVGWLARIAFVPWVGAWRYLSSVKPRLEAATKARSLPGGC
jgi:hypothetical protein